MGYGHQGVKLYLADNIVGNFIYCLEFEAANDKEAQDIAKEKGWVYLGEKEGEFPCDAEVEAAIEKAVYDPTIH